MLWEDRREHLNQKAIESPLVELIPKLRVKVFTKQRRVEKSVSDTEETTLENKRKKTKMMYLETK